MAAAAPPTLPLPTSRSWQRLCAVRWGALIGVAIVHAAGLLALTGVGEPRPSAPPQPPVAVMVDFVAPAPPSPELAPPRPPQPAPPPPAKQPEAQPQTESSAPKPTTEPPVPRPPRESPAPKPPTVQEASSAAPSEPSSAASVAPADASPSAVGAQEAQAPISAPPPSKNGPEGAGLPTISASADAAYLNNPRPAYPTISRRRGEEGRVVLKVLVSSNGRPDVVEVAESSGHPRLDEAARKAVHAWRFVPARRGEEAVDSWLRVPIVFRLEE